VILLVRSLGSPSARRFERYVEAASFKLGALLRQQQVPAAALNGSRILTLVVPLAGGRRFR